MRLSATVQAAVVAAIASVVTSLITTTGTIVVSRPEARVVKNELAKLSEVARIMNLPVGTIVSSMLPPGVFSKEVGDPSTFDAERSRWVLADGTTDITRSRYGERELRIGHKPPDLRGMFLRGINEGRLNGGDPDGQRKAGDEQPDALLQHAHGLGAFLGENRENNYKLNVRGYGFEKQGDSATGNVSGVVDKSIAKETRPRNVAVYMYLKIN